MSSTVRFRETLIGPRWQAVAGAMTLVLLVVVTVISAPAVIGRADEVGAWTIALLVAGFLPRAPHRPPRGVEGRHPERFARVAGVSGRKGTFMNTAHCGVGYRGRNGEPGESGMTPDERKNTFLRYPEWFGGDRVPESLTISQELRDRLRAWNRTWETVLDPVMEVRWPDPEIGHRWIAEGEQLVVDLRDELAPGVAVVGDFARYAPPSG